MRPDNLPCPLFGSDVPASIIQNDHNARAVVTVTAANGSIPTGQVTMSYSGFQGGVAFPHPLVTGTPAYPLDSLPVGTYQLTATYAAQGNYQASHQPAMLPVTHAGAAGPMVPWPASAQG